MKTCASREEKGKRFSNVINVIILGETSKLKGELPKIIPKLKILKENKRNLTEEK